MQAIFHRIGLTDTLKMEREKKKGTYSNCEMGL